MADKFSATWVSHSSLADFVQCPRAYFLKNVYKDPHTNHKIQVVTPQLTLGSAVHEVLEALTVVPTAERFKDSLLVKFDKIWQQVGGKQGGFLNKDSSRKYYDRGRHMLERVMRHPGPLLNLSVKIKESLPQYWLSLEDNIILCGKIDWLEYLPDTDSVHIIDFKTGARKEAENSLQLPIYYLLVRNTQRRQVAKASYWYLDSSDELEEKPLPDLEEAHNSVLNLAKKVKLARQLQVFKCHQGEKGCFACRPFERILKGEGEQVGVDNYNHDLYILPTANSTDEDSSMII